MLHKISTPLNIKEGTDGNIYFENTKNINLLPKEKNKNSLIISDANNYLNCIDNSLAKKNSFLSIKNNYLNSLYFETTDASNNKYVINFNNSVNYEKSKLNYFVLYNDTNAYVYYFNNVPVLNTFSLNNLIKNEIYVDITSYDDSGDNTLIIKNDLKTVLLNALNTNFTVVENANTNLEVSMANIQLYKALNDNTLGDKFIIETHSNNLKQLDLSLINQDNNVENTQGSSKYYILNNSFHMTGNMFFYIDDTFTSASESPIIFTFSHGDTLHVIWLKVGVMFIQPTTFISNTFSNFTNILYYVLNPTVSTGTTLDNNFTFIYQSYYFFEGLKNIFDSITSVNITSTTYNASTSTNYGFMKIEFVDNDVSNVNLFDLSYNLRSTDFDLKNLIIIDANLLDAEVDPNAPISTQTSTQTSISDLDPSYKTYDQLGYNSIGDYMDVSDLFDIDLTQYYVYVKNETSNTYTANSTNIVSNSLSTFSIKNGNSDIFDVNLNEFKINKNGVWNISGILIFERINNDFNNNDENNNYSIEFIIKYKSNNTVIASAMKTINYYCGDLTKIELLPKIINLNKDDVLVCEVVNNNNNDIKLLGDSYLQLYYYK